MQSFRFVSQAHTSYMQLSIAKVWSTKFLHATKGKSLFSKKITPGASEILFDYRIVWSCTLPIGYPHAPLFSRWRLHCYCKATGLDTWSEELILTTGAHHGRHSCLWTLFGLFQVAKSSNDVTFTFSYMYISDQLCSLVLRALDSYLNSHLNSFSVGCKSGQLYVGS